jgi:hypothetical protein
VKNITDEVYGVEKYEPEIGDLIVFTNIRPRSVYDLSKIKTNCHITYIHGSKDELLMRFLFFFLPGDFFFKTNTQRSTKVKS